MTHTPDTATATVTVTVADDSIDNVSSTENESMEHITDNPLIEAVDRNQTVDTINPEVTITDDQQGIAFDDANTVTYTLSFSEAVQSVTEGDLTVTGAESYTVDHTDDTDTATVTVTVADDSIDNVSITVNNSILDIAGNPLIQAVDNTQTVDTVNPTPVYSSEIIAPNQGDGASSDHNSKAAYTIDFTEPVSGITAEDIRVDGAEAVLAETVKLSEDGLQATFNVQASDHSEADLIETGKDTLTDLNGNSLVGSSRATVQVDTVNPEVSTNADDQSGTTSEGANIVTYTLSCTEAVQSITEGDLTVTGAESDTVPHDADTATATMTETVANDSIDNVSINVNDSKADIAGNPLIKAAHNSQTVDTQNPKFNLETRASTARNQMFSEIDLDTNPIVELSNLAQDIAKVEVFIIGANASDKVDADNAQATENGVVKKEYSRNSATDNAIAVKITQEDVNTLGQDGTEVFVKVTDTHDNTSVNSPGNILIHTGTVLEEETGDVAAGEVVENGFTLGTKFIPHDGEDGGKPSIIADPETGETEVQGDKINGAFTDDVYVDAGFGAVIVRNEEGMVGNAKLSLAIDDTELTEERDSIATNLEAAKVEAAKLAQEAQAAALNALEKAETAADLAEKAKHAKELAETAQAAEERAEATVLADTGAQARNVLDAATAKANLTSAKALRAEADEMAVDAQQAHAEDVAAEEAEKRAEVRKECRRSRSSSTGWSANSRRWS